MYYIQVPLKRYYISVPQINSEDLDLASDNNELFKFPGKYPHTLRRVIQSDGNIRFDTHDGRSVGLYLNLNEAIESINRNQVNAYLYPSYRFSTYWRIIREKKMLNTVDYPYRP